MKKNYTVKQLECDTAAGITRCTIHTEIGDFSSIVKIDDTDAQCPSMYHAIEIAENKAVRKFIGAGISCLKRDILLLNNLIKQVEDNKSKYPACNRLLYSTREEKRKELKLWCNNYCSLEADLRERLRARDKILKYYLERDSKEKKDKKD